MNLLFFGLVVPTGNFCSVSHVGVCLCVRSFVYIFPVFYNVLATFLLFYFFNCPCCVVLIAISVAKRLVFCVFHVNTVGSGCGDDDGGIYVELLFSFCCCMLYSTTFTHQKKDICTHLNISSRLKRF